LVIERSAANAFLVSSTTPVALTAQSLSSQRAAHTRALNNASTAFVATRFDVSVTSGVAVDFTLRIGLPQLEQGAFSTSAIPTTTAAATRAADVAVMTGANFSNWYRSDEGSLFCQWSVEHPVVGNRGPWWLSQTGVNVRGIGLIHVSANAHRVLYRDLSGAFLETPSIGGFTYPYTRSLATAFSNTAIEASADGGALATATSSTVAVFEANTLNIGEYRASGSNAGPINGHIRRLAFFPRRLADAELTSITS
jgi:hypothetical protein